jgi:hypothetical protein
MQLHVTKVSVFDVGSVIFMAQLIVFWSVKRHHVTPLQMSGSTVGRIDFQPIEKLEVVAILDNGGVRLLKG